MSNDSIAVEELKYEIINCQTKEYRKECLDGLIEILDKKNEELQGALIDASLHFVQQSFSKRPCPTCWLVSDLIGEPFGCKKKALEK